MGCRISPRRERHDKNPFQHGQWSGSRAPCEPNKAGRGGAQIFERKAARSHALWKQNANVPIGRSSGATANEFPARRLAPVEIEARCRRVQWAEGRLAEVHA